MRLVINRSQAARKGMLGGNKGVAFTLAYRLELSASEQALVREYKLDDYAIGSTVVNGVQVPLTISRLVAGCTQTVGDVTALLHHEGVIKDACDVLPPLFEVVRTFGGDEIIDYPRT